MGKENIKKEIKMNIKDLMDRYNTLRYNLYAAVEKGPEIPDRHTPAVEKDPWFTKGKIHHEPPVDMSEFTPAEQKAIKAEEKRQEEERQASIQEQKEKQKEQKRNSPEGRRLQTGWVVIQRERYVDGVLVTDFLIDGDDGEDDWNREWGEFDPNVNVISKI